jgi:hypothetical protein
MMASSEATIFLSGSRICTQDKTFRSYQSLARPFFNIISVKDETLAPDATVKHSADHSAVLLVIPLVGDVQCNQDRISPGQAMAVNSDLLLSNPHDEALVNYICLQRTATLQSSTAVYGKARRRLQTCFTQVGTRIGARGRFRSTGSFTGAA